MDEPLNHLDISTVETLEATLRDFGGTIIFVSHDRYFIDRLATQVWEMDRGHLKIYKGNFQEYLYAKEYEQSLQKEQQAQKPATPVTENSPETESKSLTREQRKEQKRKEAEERQKQSASKKEVLEHYASVERKILETEEEIETLEEKMASPEIAKNGDEMAKASKRYKELLDLKEVLYEEWAQLAEKV